MINSGSISYILFAIIAIAIFIAIFLMLIKKMFKFFLLILVLLIAYLSYQYITNSISPMAFFNNLKTDVTYLVKSAQDYSKIKKSTNQIKSLIDAGDLSDESVNKIIEENNKLHSIRDEINNMPHSKILDNYHSLYMLNLNKMVTTSDAMVLLSQGQNGSTEIINNLKEKVNNIFDYIKNIK